MAPSVQPMKTASDAIVVGAGPVGSFTALNLARLGAEVTVFEEHADDWQSIALRWAPQHPKLKKLGIVPAS